MMRTVQRGDVRELMEERNAQLVEVLPRQEYVWAHLPGAVHLPLEELDERAGELDRTRPVVVYGRDETCDLGSRAARRLDGMGFTEVCDYAAGKMDWIAAGLPYEGKAQLVTLVARRDPVLAHPSDPLTQVTDRILADPAGVAVVVDDDGVVLGIVGEKEITGAAPGATAGEAMNDGVLRVPPDAELTELVPRLEAAGELHAVVTRPDGTLVGLFGLGDLREPETEPDLV